MGLGKLLKDLHVRTLELVEKGHFSAPVRRTNTVSQTLGLKQEGFAP
jgi:hypothetical protein